MYQVVIEVPDALPDNDPFQVEVHFAGEIRVPSIVARRRVTGFLGMEVGMMLLADDPTLVIMDQKPIWRVPASLYLPGMGKVATVGSIEVNAISGELIRPSAEQIAEMQDRGDAIAARSQ